MALSIKSGIDSTVAIIDAISKGLRTGLYDTLGNKMTRGQREFVPVSQEGLLVMGKNDQFGTFLRTDRKGNILTGNYLPELYEFFEGTTVNVQKWNNTSVTFAPTQGTIGGYSHNPGASTANGAGNMLISQRLFYKLPRVPLHIKRRWRHAMVAGSISDFGFGLPSALTTLIVPNGAMFRMTSSGTIQALITYNGVEIGITNVIAQSTIGANTVGSALSMAALTSNYYVYDVVVDDDVAVFTIQDTESGAMLGTVSISVPAVALKMWGSTGLPYFERVYNTAVPSSAPIVITGELQVLSLDWNLQFDASQTASQLKLTSGANPFTGAPLTAKVNNTAPTTIALSNTAAGLSTLDGTFVFAAVAGAETDYLAVAFQVPVGSRFVFEGVVIDTTNQVVAVATTPTQLEWFMGHNQSAASLATTNKIITTIGSQSFIVGRAAGEMAVRLSDTSLAGEVTESGRFVTLGFKMPVATATATETFRVTYRIKGRFI